jgi:hypothetical protein
MQMNYSMKNLQTLIVIFLLANVGFVHAETPLDFDGDGKTDFAVHRARLVGGDLVLDWFVARSSDNVLRHWQWGLGHGFDPDIAIPEDFDGDNKTDVAVWRSSTTTGQSFFYILNSSDGTVRVEQFGQGGIDNAIVTGDYDGDGRADPAVYRAVGGQNYYIYRGSLNNPNGNLTFVPWGFGFSVSTHNGDFDGDGKRDFCVRLPGSGIFALLRSSDSGIEYVHWGLSGETTAFGDYDGDGKTDFGVRRIAGAQNEFHWYILERDGGGTGAAPIVWGGSGFGDNAGRTFVGDYDGDGRADIAVYRRNFTSGQPNTFLVRKSSDGSMMAYQLGTGSDLPIAAW